MIIVPKTPKEAEAVLSQLRSQRSHCTLYVLTPGDSGAQLASDADIRAENHPFRKVAWVGDTAVLRQPGSEALQQAVEQGAAICVMTFDNRFSSTLSPGNTGLLAIEKAFIAAEVA